MRKFIHKRKPTEKKSGDIGERRYLSGGANNGLVVAACLEDPNLLQDLSHVPGISTAVISHVPLAPLVNVHLTHWSHTCTHDQAHAHTY